MKKLLFYFLILIMLFSFLVGCSKSAENNKEDKKQEVTTVTKNEGIDNIMYDSDMFTERDYGVEYDKENVVTISLNGTSSTASSENVNISGSTITITEEATYVISGELNEGMLVVNAPDTAKLHLIFSDVNITSKNSAALYICEAEKVFLTLAEGSTNTIANGGSFSSIDDNNIDGALFSKQDLTINGAGSLKVTSPVGHGIVCKDDLVITGGSYEINSASNGLDVNDSVRITNAKLDIDSGKDAIHCENNDDISKGFVYVSSGNILIEAEGDGISAYTYMQITDGNLELLVGGGSKNGTKERSDSFGGFMGGGRPGGKRPEDTQNIETESESTSMKGLKSAGNIMISGGNIVINSADDAIHSDTSLEISGGTFTIASGDDAIHAEETVTIKDGNIDISESYEGVEALHIDIQNGDIKIVANDDGLNAAGGKDESGTTGGRDAMFGGGIHGGMGDNGGMFANSNGSINISGGSLYINSSGDGIDANGTLEISGGDTTVVGPTQGDTATLDYDKEGNIKGGSFIGTGSMMMAQSFSDSQQGVIGINAGNQAAGTQITLKDLEGNTLVSYKPEMGFEVIIISVPELVKGEKYSITVGSESGEFEAN